jgi:hypothetical protein
MAGVKSVLGQPCHDLVPYARGPNTEKGQARWWCECKGCGRKDVLVLGQLLRKKAVKSCGCSLRRVLQARNYKHGHSRSRTHIRWKAMIGRCYNPNHPYYHSYGGRGVRAETWKGNFQRFLDEMGEWPGRGYSLDRIDPNGDYCKENCRWATTQEQANNKRNTRFVEYEGERISLSDLARLVQLPRERLYHRIFVTGWSVEEAASTPQNGVKNHKREGVPHHAREMRRAHNHVRLAIERGDLIKPSRCSIPGCNETDIEAHHHKGYEPEHILDVVWLCTKHHVKVKERYYEAWGILKRLTEWARLSGLSRWTIRNRLATGLWSVEEALTTPRLKRGQRRPGMEPGPIPKPSWLVEN